MIFETDDLRIQNLRPLIPPAILMEELPLGERSSRTVAEGRQRVQAVLRGDDDRLVVVVGPCSIHDPRAALEYADRLRKAAERTSGDLLIVMRVYFEKPRTTVGWKGLINDPHLDESFAINEGLRIGAAAPARAGRGRAAGGLRVPRSDQPAVHRGSGVLGRDRRAHDREPGASRAGLGPVDARRLQERHGRQRAGRRRRDPRGGEPAPFPVRDEAGRGGDRGDARQLRHARDPARRRARPELRRRRASPRCASSSPRRGCRSA